MRPERMRQSYLLMLCLMIAGSGCGLVKDIGAGVANRVIDAQVARIGPKLHAKYGITDKDTWKSAVKKMAAVEGKNDPALMNKLLKIGPEAWQVMTDSNANWKEKVAAGIKTIGELDTAVAESKDEHGNTKIVGGSTGAIMLGMLMFFLRKWRTQKAATEAVLTAVEDPNPPDKGGIKGAIKNKNNSLVNAMVTDMFPDHENAA